MFFLLYKHTDDGVFEDFPKITDHFPNISEGFIPGFPPWRVHQNCSEGQTNVPEHFPRISENFRRCPKTFEEDPKMFRWYNNKFKDVRAHCYCASLVRKLFIRHARVRSFSSASTESKTQQNIELMTFVLAWCANILLGDPHFFFGISLPFLILSIILYCGWKALGREFK